MRDERSGRDATYPNSSPPSMLLKLVLGRVKVRVETVSICSGKMSHSQGLDDSWYLLVEKRKEKEEERGRRIELVSQVALSRSDGELARFPRCGISSSTAFRAGL